MNTENLYLQIGAGEISEFCNLNGSPFSYPIHVFTNTDVSDLVRSARFNYTLLKMDGTLDILKENCPGLYRRLSDTLKSVTSSMSIADEDQLRTLRMLVGMRVPASDWGLFFKRMERIKIPLEEPKKGDRYYIKTPELPINPEKRNEEIKFPIFNKYKDLKGLIDTSRFLPNDFDPRERRGTK